MFFDFATLDPKDRYKRITSTIVPRPIALECCRGSVLQFAENRDLVIGEIVDLHACDGIIGPDTLYLDWYTCNPIGRLYADQYIRTHDRFTMRIPVLDKVMTNKSEK